jgi:hypothetical protein
MALPHAKKACLHDMSTSCVRILTGLHLVGNKAGVSNSLVTGIVIATI